jgi:hypothetical protein
MQNYYTPVGGLGINYLGQAIDAMPGDGTALAPTPMMSSKRYPAATLLVYGGILIVSSGASAFHGYRRGRGSVGGAIGWGLLGALFPIITPAVALAQGFGKPKVTGNRRRRRTSRRPSRRRTSRGRR